MFYFPTLWLNESISHHLTIACPISARPALPSQFSLFLGRRGGDYSDNLRAREAIKSGELKLAAFTREREREKRETPIQLQWPCTSQLLLKAAVTHKWENEDLDKGAVSQGSALVFGALTFFHPHALFSIVLSSCVFVHLSSSFFAPRSI